MCTLHEASIIKLALIYQDLGYLEQAKEYQQRSLAIRLGKLSPEHVAVATSANNLTTTETAMRTAKEHKFILISKAIALQVHHDCLHIS